MISCNESKDDYKYLTLITAGQKSGTGIRYVDIIPDDTTLGYYDHPELQSKNLDLDGDGNNDFELIFSSNTEFISHYSYGLKIKPLEMNSVCVTASGDNWVDSLEFNDTINYSDIWSDSTALLYDYYRYIKYTDPKIHDTTIIKGYWYDNDNIYIGVKIMKDTHQFLGWIDLKRNVQRGFIDIRQFAITMPY
jgi:hypothetical protein